VSSLPPAQAETSNKSAPASVEASAQPAAPAPAESLPGEAKAEVPPAPRLPDTATVAASADADATSDTSAESVAEEAADEPESTDDDAQTPALDVDRAADLLADWMARQDLAAGDNADVPPSTKALATFDQEEADPDWSAPTAQQIEATLDQWLDALPDEVRAHVDIIHVECRLTMCQILAADDDIASQTERVQSSQEWRQAIATLPHQPWWTELGFIDITNAVNTDHANGYILYQTYLRRGVNPPG
jgi:hypothetical protein